MQIWTLISWFPYWGICTLSAPLFLSSSLKEFTAADVTQENGGLLIYDLLDDLLEKGNLGEIHCCFFAEYK